jgi:uncharacterized membrane protein
MKLKKVTEEEKRPKIEIPETKLEKILEILAIIVILAVSAYTIIMLRSLPSRVPTHYDFLGMPDAYGAKSSLLILPGIVLFIYILITIASYFPHIFNYAVKITEENYIRQYTLAKQFLAVLRFEFCLVFGYLNISGILTAKGTVKGLGWGFVVVTGIVLFGTIGLFVYKQIKGK